ncbi:MAG: 4Fe-4S binding protein, partial [Lentisphaeria bacterium]|nr:4Fe-4S binding protein [Lentisphaeria bacterium]
MKQKHLKSIRIAVAAVMFVLFFGVGLGVSRLNAVLVTQFGPGLMSLTSVFFVDTLAAVVLIVLVTLLFGRIYCSVLCPLGILQDGIAFLAQRINGKAHRRYRFLDTRPVKYGVFLFVLILGAAGVMLPLI